MKIFLVDDEKDLTKVVSAHLCKHGFSVDVVNSGSDAISYLEKNIPDIIILDIRMPDVDGYMVLEKIRLDKRTAKIPVIALTAKDAQSDKIDFLDKGADDYILKPFDAGELVSRVNAILRRINNNQLKGEKNIFITGGAGFIGSHLAKVLLGQGHEVTIMDDFSTGNKENLKDIFDNKKLHIVRGSITDEVLLSKCIEKSDIVYHLAATVGVKNVVDNTLDTLIYDTFGTEQVLKYASAKGAKVIMTSTSEVYGKSKEIPFREDSDLVIGPPDVNRWSYACSKLLDEFLAIAYHKERGLPVVVVRLFNVVGPGQVGKYGMVIPRFFQNALQNKPIVVYGDGEQLRCFTYVDDIVEILAKLPDLENAVGQVINLGSNNKFSIKELALKVKEITKSSSEIVFEPYNKYYGEHFEDIQRRVPDLTKLKNIFGAIPSTSIDIILKKIKEYYESVPDAIKRN
jgi:UDP-glucose 4-epimerase